MSDGVTRGGNDSIAGETTAPAGGDGAARERPWRARGAFALAFLAGFLPSLGVNLSFDGHIEPDVYFHLTAARDYVAGGFAPSSFTPRLDEGVLAEHPADREPLYHAALGVLLWSGLSDEVAAKLLAALLSGALALVLYTHSRSLLVTLAGVFATNTFLYRMLMCRPHGLAIVLVLLGVSLLVRRRYRWAAAVNLVYTLSYSVPILIGLAAVFEAVARRHARGVGWIAGASALGLLVHPHFPDNVVVLWYQGGAVMANLALGNPAGVPVPGELRPWEPLKFLTDAWLPLALFAFGVVRRAGPGWLLFLQGALLLLTLGSLRFIEYWAPLVCLSAGPVIEYLVPRRPVALRWLVVALFLCARPVVGVYAAAGEARTAAASPPVYREAALWLRENAAGESVFNADYAAYPQLVYFGGTFGLAQGMDPVFVAAYDPDTYASMRAAIDGELTLDAFRRQLGQRFIVVEQGTPLAAMSFHGGRIAHLDPRVVVIDTGGSSSAPSPGGSPRPVGRVPR